MSDKKEQYVWMSSYCYYDEYTFVGLYHNQYDAFLACLEHNKKYRKSFNLFDNDKNHEFGKVFSKRFRLTKIKRWTNYHIKKVPIQEFKRKHAEVV